MDGPPLWPHQRFALEEVPRRLLAGERRVCLTSPTGGGKTKIVTGLIEWARTLGWYVVLYTNRRLLLDQLSAVLGKAGIGFGVRASGYADERHLPVQVSSLPTERVRTLKGQRWGLHGEGETVLAIVDECHLNNNDTARRVLQGHLEQGGRYVGVTATPVGLGGMFDSLVVAGTPSQLRKCGALVPAYHYGVDEPDMRRFKPSVKTGEYVERDVVKAIMTKCVMGRVLQHYRKLNPEGRPTILFAPGVQESIWFAEQFARAGVRAAHVDGEGVWRDGHYDRGGDRQRLLDDVRSGDVRVLCNRFVLREGLDLPEVSHLILATVMGGLSTYLQSAGRGMRSCPGKGRLTIQDHGGHYHRHGSVNADRDWKLGDTEHTLAASREDMFRNPPPGEPKPPEPIRCPECDLVRAAGPKCPGCGHEGTRRSRRVIQEDGTLREHAGDVYKPRVTRQKPDTQKLWEGMYYRAKRSRNRMTFRAAYGLFAHENGYWPPRDLKFMPRTSLDWFVAVIDVPADRLR